MTRKDRKARTRPPAGETFRLTLDSLSHRGSAVGRLDGQVVFALYGIPGEEVNVLVERAYPDYLEGVVTAVHRASPHRVPPRCPYVGSCGGCQFQHIDYVEQLRLKTEVVREQLRRIGHLPDAPVLPAIAAPSPFNYRNHARFSVDGDGHLGFVRRNSRWVVRIEECHIILPAIQDALATIQAHELPRLHQVAVRVGERTGDRLIQPDLSAWAPELQSGQGSYEEELAGRRFRVSASSFFQVNTPQAETLIRLVREGLTLRPDDILLDAYAGGGTFAAVLAADVAEVIAVEVSAPSVADGRHNTADLPTVRWIAGEVERVLPELELRPTAVVLDPSRPGCAPPALAALIEARVPRLAYVSCEPATLARDLRILVDGGYRLRSVQPVDLFPQTYHIESVSLLDWPA